jgi:3',5'-cyclic AMP phosphodiesterase CpdA
MPIEKSFGQQRIQKLIVWAEKASIPGMKQETYLKIFDYVLEEQDRRGFWTMSGKNWEVVMTAVVLKALTALRFEAGDQWPTKIQTDGGMSHALSFLNDEVEKKDGRPEVIGEDVWDACQAALALAGFDGSPKTFRMVQQVNTNWKFLYENTCKTAGNRWCGPAYLAAMVDVIGRYESELAEKSHCEEALNHLKNLEEKDLQGNPLGFFAASKPRNDMNLWTTSLVLRTLSTVPEERESLVDRQQVQRVANWLLGQIETDVWEQDWGEAPMLLARGLHGLQTARLWVDSKARERINNSLKAYNRRLEEFFMNTPDRRGDLKAYTAVIEYLADWTLPAPAGLIFHAGKNLSVSTVARSSPVPRDGGLRIVWLSDLHVEADDKSVPGTVSPLKRFAGNLMQFKATPLTQYFKIRNMQTILSRARELKPDHILVTGDLTNYARESQFRSVHDEFLNTQAMLRKDGTTVTPPVAAKLDPSLWTILPGNHDVTNESAGDGVVRANLGMFFKYFANAYDFEPQGNNFDLAFPLIKRLKGRNGDILVRLIGLDSTVSNPVWDVGVNARGRVDVEQMSRLTKRLSEEGSADIVLVALHHHPIVVVELNSAIEDYFLSLKEGDGRKLVKLCANTGVSAILHGHFHCFSTWSGLTPSNRQLAILGSPAGTVNILNNKEEFLEFREADRETPDEGVQRGLGLYSHQRWRDGTWGETFTGVFLPQPALVS